VYTQVESELVSIRAEWTQTIADLQCNLLMIFGLAIAVIFSHINNQLNKIHRRDIILLCPFLNRGYIALHQ
jgi:hypothetical protein